MLWIRFDEQDRRSSAPPFCLNSSVGERVCLQDLYEKNNLVLVFMRDDGCSGCESTINAFGERNLEYRDQQSKVLLVFPTNVQQLNAHSLENDGFLEGYSMETRSRLLLDPGGDVRRAYLELISNDLLGEADNILFVLDAYGAPYTALIDKDFSDVEVHDEVLKWLQYINIQCPE